MLKKLLHFGKKIFIFLNIVAVIGLLLSYLSTHLSPEKWIFLAIFGLSYVFWLGLNIFFVLFWLFSKRKLALLSLLTILVGYGHFASYFQIFPHFFAAKPETAKSIKVVSYNVRLFGWYDWKKNTVYRDSLIAGLKSEAADVYCFQEYFYHSDPGKFDTESIIKAKLETPYVHNVFNNWVGKHQKYGIATFSKFPIVDGGIVPFKYDDGNICIYTDVLIYGDTIRVFNAHVASIRFQTEDYRIVKEIKNPDHRLKQIIDDGFDILNLLNIAFKKRAQQVNMIVDSINASPYPTILCTDLNDTPVSYAYARLADVLTDSFRESGRGMGRTYIGKFPSFRIDYIFHGDIFRAVDYHTLPANISDHHGIGTTLYWN